MKHAMNRSWFSTHLIGTEIGWRISRSWTHIIIVRTCVHCIVTQMVPSTQIQDHRLRSPGLGAVLKSMDQFKWATQTTYWIDRGELVQSMDIPPGQEKLCVPEGSRWHLVRSEISKQPDFFALPSRTVNVARIVRSLCCLPSGCTRFAIEQHVLPVDCPRQALICTQLLMLLSNKS
ncbi:hypothetical protein OG21DRAFT_966110 [Imleria badia]|nr:hypothetical protein OG21DRAFT_966110 [Imleria badia]